MWKSKEELKYFFIKLSKKKNLENIFTSEFAALLDEQDPIRDKRNLFYIPKKRDFGENPSVVDEEDCIYLCGNSLGLQPRKVETFIKEELDNWKKYAVQGHFRGKHQWLTIDELVVPQMAQVVGAKELEVAVASSLSVNLHLLMIPFYRPTQIRHKIIIEKGAFPSDLYIASSQISFHGFSEIESLVQLEPRPGEYYLRTEDIIAEINKHGNSLALVLLPAIQYSTGQYFDIKSITAAGHKVGAYVGFDCAHAVGNVKLSLHDWNVDFACWCSYKYLNSGPGGIGGYFVHSKHANDTSLPRFAAWWGHDLSTRFQMDQPFKPIPGAFGYRLSNTAVLTTVALLASLEIFDEVGMDALVEKQYMLTGYLEILLEKHLSDELIVITPKNPSERGCQLSLLCPMDAKVLEHKLANEGVIVDARGKIVRVSPVPLYNSFSDVYQFVKIFTQILKSKSRL